MMVVVVVVGLVVGCWEEEEGSKKWMLPFYSAERRSPMKRRMHRLGCWLGYR